MRHPSDHLLHGHIDRVLPAAHDRRVREHLKGCPDCAGKAAELRRIVDSLALMPQERAPAGFVESVSAAARAESGSARIGAWRPWAALAAGVSLVIFGALIWGNLQTSPPVQTAQEQPLPVQAVQPVQPAQPVPNDSLSFYAQEHQLYEAFRSMPGHSFGLASFPER